MRRTEQTSRFKRDYKREARGAHRATLQADLTAVLKALVHDEPLAERYHDHSLTGDWRDHRDCHIKPDLILIYRKPNAEVLQLVRLGSHAELGLTTRRPLLRANAAGYRRTKQIPGAARNRPIALRVWS